MIQRFSMLVWPDQSPEWKEVDRYPASEPRAAAIQAFQRLDELTPDLIGVATDQFALIPCLRFDEGAQDLFNEWRQELETRLRSGDLSPALESHFAKYRKLVPSLALINHLVFRNRNAPGAGLRQILGDTCHPSLWGGLGNRDFGRKGDTFPDSQGRSAQWFYRP
jgi:Protein of unknown function (DUF3987)